MSAIKFQKNINLFNVSKLHIKKLLGGVAILILFSLLGCGGGGGGSSGSGSVGSATLTWNAPTTNADGSPLTDLAGYKIYYGTSSGNYSVSVDVRNVTTYTVDSLSSGKYYFAVTAYDTSNNESGYSNEVSKQI